MDAQQIMAMPDNRVTIREFFTGIASGRYYNWMCYRLYLDLDDNSIYEYVEASENTWQQRDDGSLAEIACVCGYINAPDDLYSRDEKTSLDDWGYEEWLDGLAIEIGNIQTTKENENV